MQLYKHQQKAVDESPNKWCLFFRMRVGKTATSIRLASTRVKSAIIICPKSILTQWEEEVERWNNSDCKFMVTTPERFKKHCKELPRYEAVICDEAHRGFGNYKSQTFKALIDYIKHHKVEYTWLLTGTPFTSTSWSVYSYGTILGRDWPWYKWKKYFFYDKKMGRRWIPFPRRNRDKDLQEILRRIGTVIDIKDVMEVMEDEEIVETFDLNNEQKKHIDNITDVLPIVRYNKIHQLESGVLKSDGYSENLIFECDKDKRLKQIVEDNDKIVIVCRYLNQVEKYRNMFKNKTIFVISGQEKSTAGEVAKLAESAKHAVVIVQADTCVGYSLQSFSVMVFTSLGYSFVNYDQMRFRLKNMNKKTPDTYIHLVTSGDSLDKAHLESIRRKEDFSFELYAKKHS